MKRFCAMLLVVVLCLALTCPVLAAEDDFVPSITYKPMPEMAGEKADDGCVIIGYIEQDGEAIGQLHYDNGVIYIDNGVVHETVEEGHKCLVITSVADAETSDEIPAASREMLLWVYDQLLKLGMDFIDNEALNADIAANLGEGKTVKDLVVRDLFDVSVLCDPLKEYLEPEGTTVRLDFELGLAPNTYVAVLVYKNDRWEMIENVEVNADGSVTCTTYENFCPVAILVPEGTPDTVAEAPATGTDAANNIVLWSVVAAGALAALVVLTVVQRKRTSGR